MVSRSQADKAGERIRHALREADGRDEDSLAASYRVLSLWRHLHREPLDLTTQGLAQFLRDSDLAPEDRVFLRLKRESQIVQKLLRQRSRLSSMSDIAGCRAVLPTEEDVYRLVDRLLSPAEGLEVLRVRDYIRDETHPTGYQAVHVLGRYGGYRVEIQLRTEVWHAWAMRVEKYDHDTGEDAKHGNADPEALGYFERLGRRLVTLGEPFESGHADTEEES